MGTGLRDCSSYLDVAYAMMHCWTTRGRERLDSPGARPRHQSFADRASLRQAVERVWPKHFHADNSLTRRPMR